MVSLKLFAGTDVGLRENNEDNFIVCPDLSQKDWIVPSDFKQVIPLGSMGCVMVVADGMGGQNAGEIASAIAINTVKTMFSDSHLQQDIFESRDGIKSFLKRVILECDSQIKINSEMNPDRFGMGSTIVIAWIIGRKLFIAWLGDSRAYSFVPGKGIARLSKDHSYVQQLVDAGMIDENEAMHHPDSNVITRSLGDPSQKAKADVREYDVEDGEIVLLCTDGLCGVCTDEEIGGILEDEYSNLQQCKEKLTTAALSSGGADNITICLIQILIDVKDRDNSNSNKKSMISKFGLLLTILLGVCLFIFLICSDYLSINEQKNKEKVRISLAKETLKPGEKTYFHIFQSGNILVSLEYDHSLIEVNLKDSIVSIKNKVFTKDTITYISVVCGQNREYSDSVLIKIKKINLEENVEDVISKTSNKGEKSNKGEISNNGDKGDRSLLGDKGGDIITISNAPTDTISPTDTIRKKNK